MFKKNICLILSSFLILCLLCSCSTKKEVVDNSEETTVGENDTKASEYVLKGEYLKEYKDIEVSEESKFLGTAIVNLRPEEYRITDIPIISKEDKNADLIFTLMHLNPDYLEEFAISTTENNTRAYTVAILKAKKGYEGELVVSLSNRIDDLKRTVKNYPDQLYLVDNVVMQQVGDYLVFIVCDNADKVYDEIVKVMNSTDLNDITVVPMLTEEERVILENDYLNEEQNKITDSIDEVIVTPIEDLNE